MTITKFEAAGIGFSICAMALALWILEFRSTSETLTTTAPDAEDDAVFVADGENQRAAVADALLEASSESGSLSRLIIDDVVVGSGATAEVGDTVEVHYIGTLQNGQQFDNSYLKGAPFRFTLGEGRVIEGWERGILGMQEGGQRILVVPAELGYGGIGYGPIPANATLVFAVELVSIEE